MNTFTAYLHSQDPDATNPRKASLGIGTDTPTTPGPPRGSGRLETLFVLDLLVGTMASTSTVAWRNWRAHLDQDVISESWESALYSESQFTGHLQLGPYQLLLTHGKTTDLASARSENWEQSTGTSWT